MPKYDKPIKEWNAITYLRDFINTYLVLSHREQAVWDFVQKHGDQQQYFYTKPTRGTVSNQYRRCMRCEEIKPVEAFMGKGKICLECRKSEKRICKQKKKQ